MSTSLTFQAPSSLNGDALVAQIVAAGYEGIIVRYYPDDATVVVTGRASGSKPFGEQARDAIARIISDHVPPPIQPDARADIRQQLRSLRSRWSQLTAAERNEALRLLMDYVAEP